MLNNDLQAGYLEKVLNLLYGKQGQAIANTEQRIDRCGQQFGQCKEDGMSLCFHAPCLSFINSNNCISLHSSTYRL
jgi:hypothetical protein